MKEMMDQIKKVWAGLSGGQRALFYGVGGLAVLGIVAAVAVGGGVEWTPLQSGLATADLTKVVARLDDQGIPVKITDGGTTVMVPSDRLSETRTLLGREGLVQSDSRMGWEALGNTSITITDKQREKMHLVMQQNELAKTIEKYEDISSATVIITPGRRGVSREAHRPAKASITVITNASATIRPGTVEAIVSTVSQSVEGLEPSNVVVTDSSGAVLAGGPGATGSMTRSATLAREHSRMLAETANAEFAKAFGPGKVRVTVNAELDMKSIESESERFDPDGRAIEREVRDSSQSTRPRNSRGTVSTAATQADSNGGDGQSREERTATDYRVSSTRERTVDPGGHVRRLTLAVFADEALADHKDAIASTAQNAVGFDATRDAFSIGFVPMIPLPEPVAAPTPGLLQRPETLEYAKYGVTALVGVGLLFFLMKSGTQARKGVRSALSRLEDERLERQRLMAKDKRRELTDDIVELVDRDTDSVGKLLRSWLYEPAKV